MKYGSAPYLPFNVRNIDCLSDWVVSVLELGRCSRGGGYRSIGLYTPDRIVAIDFITVDCPYSYLVGIVAWQVFKIGSICPASNNFCLKRFADRDAVDNTPLFKNLNFKTVDPLALISIYCTRELIIPLGPRYTGRYRFFLRCQWVEGAKGVG